MNRASLTAIVADDERPARRFLTGMLKACPGIELVGEATSGEEAVTFDPDTAPATRTARPADAGGLDVVRWLAPDVLPLVAFVTAFDDHAIEAFELNAIDYLLKPVQRERLQATLDRARERIARREPNDGRAAAMANAATAYERAAKRQYAERLPLRQRDKVALGPVRTIVSIVAEAELLHITMTTNETYTITHRLHALEARLDPRRFIRLGRGTVANIETIAHVHRCPAAPTSRS
jgi:two-component system LytT family response regulator